MIWVLSFLLAVSISYAAPQPETFQFREPHSVKYRMSEERDGNGQWIIAVPENSPTNVVQIGSRMVLQLEKPDTLPQAISKRQLTIARKVNDRTFILQAPDALTAAREADVLARLPGVTACYPLMKREADLDARYGPLPNDYWFAFQPYHENRYPDGTRFAADLNSRSAWAWTRGAGVTIAVADGGIELDHPEFVGRTATSLHYNFEINQPSGVPPNNNAIHGTAVAGQAVAAANNQVGVVGMAPESQLASWVVIATNQALASRQFLVDDESMMDMFQYQSNAVQVQNHSWAFQSAAPAGIGALADIGISNAVTFGRNGRGSVIVRSGGNHRANGHNANDNAMRSDPRVVGVAAATFSGRVAEYSNPGACLLVAGIGGDNTYYMFSTDRQGSLGYNGILIGKSPLQPTQDTNFGDYATGFTGTSAAAPQISGLAALMLSVNPNLSYRDVQQVLVHSARHFDFVDPDLRSNGAGFMASHNVGFGIPDAGEAVRLALNWPNRPALTNVSVSEVVSTAIPDGALRVFVSGDNVPPLLQSIAAAPSLGVHADTATPVLPLVDVGFVTNTVTIDLTNKAALIQHGTNGSFADQISRVAQAGARFAVLFFYSDEGMPSAMINTFSAAIPAVLIGNTRGLALREYLQTNGTGLAQISLNSATRSFAVPETLICEHVGVRVGLNHPSRADLRITLVSPHGTRSVLQHVNGDDNTAPTDWTYWSTHHFYESSAGTWTVAVSDEFPGGSGTIESVELLIRGVVIADSDADGLDDVWETTHFGSITAGPTDDPDKDGYNNAREQVMGSDPNAAPPLQIDFSRWDPSRGRVSWPGSTNFNYSVFAGPDVANLPLVTNLSGKFPEMEWFPLLTNRHFFRVTATPAP